MASTATEWIAENPEDVEALGELLMGVEDLPIRLWTEIPQWMKEEIAKQLNASFSEPYWDDIAKTTAGDAEKALAQGLEDGWSIRKIAKEMTASLGGDDYAKVRAMNIARTESGNALNGARKASYERLMDDLGPVVKMRPSWLSVLGPTTRDSHASLDGVPSDSEGNWTLAGIKVPWPGHYSLPAEERCNCQCTVSMEFGIQDDTARQLIQEYYDRDESNLGEQA